MTNITDLARFLPRSASLRSSSMPTGFLNSADQTLRQSVLAEQRPAAALAHRRGSVEAESGAVAGRPPRASMSGLVRLSPSSPRYRAAFRGHGGGQQSSSSASSTAHRLWRTAGDCRRPEQPHGEGGGARWRRARCRGASTSPAADAFDGSSSESEDGPDVASQSGSADTAITTLT